MRNRWIYMSFRWKFYSITEKSYSNRSNLSVIGKETYQYQHEISSFWDFFSCLTWISQAVNCINFRDVLRRTIVIHGLFIISK